jgi:hypothetical protein
MNHRGKNIMKKLTIAFVLSILLISAVYAGTYNYSCKAGGKTYPLRVDENKKVLEWRGKRYSITVSQETETDSGCAKYGWDAKGNGTSFRFCTATKGVAGFIYPDGNENWDCDLKRNTL